MLYEFIIPRAFLPHRIVYQVVQDPDNQRIGINFNIRREIFFSRTCPSGRMYSGIIMTCQEKSAENER
jgi:hypothetical protein